MFRGGAAIAIAVQLGAVPAVADVFSPGPLSAAHGKLEGIRNCTECHVAGGQLSQARCLDCHGELKERISKRQGFHGRLSDSERSCSSCHHEHQGKDFRLIDWGAGGIDGFDHRRTGFPLLGKHAQARCDECHVQRFIVDPGVRKLLASHPGQVTYLGVGTDCATCHFDEHRGQLGLRCASCHGETGWRPAPGFDHGKTDFRLEGKHTTVECLKCHAQEKDAIHAGAVPAPVHEAFSRFKPVAHDSCVDCHKDPHEGRFGQTCNSCHTAEGWLSVKQASSTGARAFHEKTRFPLRGAHAEVACKACHGPFPGVPAVFKGLRFDTCTSCHVDAHLGQLGDPPPSCDRCHSVDGFRPVRYEVADHKVFPLEGAHAAVSCLLCHVADKRLAAKARPIRLFLEKRKRKDELSLLAFHLRGNTARCDTCHSDPHGRQFAERVRSSGCVDCHVVESFAQVRFDHARSRFPLAGRHVGVACASCHLKRADGVVRYRPLDVACASCHADPHAGQFAAAGGGPAQCTRCHDVRGWKPASFEHRPPFTAFVLQGRHETAACEACHRDVRAPGGVRVTQFKGLPLTCAGCHVDVHRGAFAEFTP